jgi:hypothetical protein
MEVTVVMDKQILEEEAVVVMVNKVNLQQLAVQVDLEKLL